MIQGFWQHLPRPIIGLSPMDGVTDAPYRYIQKKYGKPDIILTEFTAAEGISRNAIKLLRDFLFDEAERPVVAQIFGKEPRSFRITALILCYLGFDGIDINMGCPAKSVEHHGSGAALIRTPKLAQEIIRETMQGVQDWVNGMTLDAYPDLKQKTKQIILSRHKQLPPQYQERRAIPVSVKTRVGYDHPVVEEWIPYLLEMEPAAISLHGRTLKQLYSGEANWDEIAKAAELVHQTPTLILGNGDITSVQQAYDRINATGVDGVLVGRATFGNPWILRDLVTYRELTSQREENSFAEYLPTIDDRIEVACDHARTFTRIFPEEGFLPMRKNLAWYIKGLPNAGEYRAALVQANSAQEAIDLLQPLRSTISPDLAD